MKRAFDIVVASTALVLLMPVLVLVVVLIWLSMGRPIFFVQQRPGLNGVPFNIYKFRTMLLNVEGVTVDDGHRLTRIGRILRRTSLDELPELLNVIKGEMSLVGPRPLLMQYLPLYSPWQFRRHEIRPGLTGWAQINGRNEMSWDNRFELDIWYVDNRNFWLDLKILAITIIKVLKGDGVSQSGHATMPPFGGA